MVPLRDVVAALYGAYRLARFDSGGMSFFEISETGFWRSFFAAVLVAPFFLALLLVRFQMVPIEAPLFRYLAIEAIAYVIAWVAFPLVMANLVRAFERESHFIRLIVAYNWASVWQNCLYLPIVMLASLGAFSDGVANGVSFIALVYILVYTWFVARTALEIPAIGAAGVVAVDLFLSVVINAVADGVI